MPRDGSGIFSLTNGPFAPDTTIASAAMNGDFADLVNDANAARPVTAGGTGGVSVTAGFDGLAKVGTTVASASTIDLDAATGPLIDISGTTSITAVTLAGKIRVARATGAFTLTASATLVVNKSTSVNYTTASGDLLFFRGYAGGEVDVWAVPAPAASSSVFSDSAFAIQDNGDATKQLAFEVSGITTGTKRVATPPNSNFIMAALDVAAQVVTGGARITSNAVGTVSSGTTTLDPGTRPMWDYTNNGAHTLAPGTNKGSILLDITNGASAGAITVSGWTKVVGAFDTTSSHKFRCSASIGAAGSLLTIQAMQ